jgi:hypothetical protein
MQKFKFFDQAFKMLLSVTFSTWAIFIFMLVLFSSRAGECTEGTMWLFTVSAWTAGILSAPPLLYGLARILFWDNGTKNGKTSGIVLVVGTLLFVSVVTLFALAVSRYGCL